MIQVIPGHGKRSSGASDLNPDAQQSCEHDQRPEVDMKSGGEVGSAPPLFTPEIVASAPHYETLAMSITHSKDLLFGSLLLIPRQQTAGQSLGRSRSLLGIRFTFPTGIVQKPFSFFRCSAVSTASISCICCVSSFSRSCFSLDIFSRNLA